MELMGGGKASDKSSLWITNWGTGKGVLVFMRIYMSAIAERLHEDIKADVIMIIIFKDYANSTRRSEQ